ncbi:hypothetical protein HH212_01925 [Massilia forsythiae]|uniref:Uncharacterized protein n=1 Tax=Massilia forsythiae TaxID=2728020 RepID=A0A7Z2ZR92_9BURK|nr:hypothetical protein [Massilia forsythiae]QJD98943.1 hypothetical protein HH212_01925 [Massilia forsythiae]
MGKSSRKKRRAHNNSIKKSHSQPVIAVLTKAVWTSAQVIATGISIYQAFDESTKTLIKTVLTNGSLGFVTNLRTLSNDEQIVQVGKLIGAQREIGKWLRQDLLPPMKNTFNKFELANGLEQILLDSIKIPEKDLQEYFSTWLSYWKLSSSIPVKNEAKRPRKI